MKFAFNPLVPDLWIHPNNSVVVTLNAGEIVVSDAFSAGITLRFPRITKVRQGADSKHASDIESEESLREKYWDVQNSRSRSAESVTSFNLGSPDKNRVSAPCRFLTEKQYRESLKRRKDLSRKSKQLKTVSIPEVEAVSAVLKGMSFAVLGGSGYAVSEDTIEMDEARELGWCDKVQIFSDVNSIIEFIKHHGGKYKISVDNDCTFVLGGSANDPKVVTYIRAIENARSQTAAFIHKSTTKKGQELAKIACNDGVIRWTFIVSLVYRWFSANHNGQESIMATNSKFMKPTVLDYLIRPNFLRNNESIVDNSIYESNLSSRSKMRRAIELVNKAQSIMDQDASNSSKNWRMNSFQRLNESERWVASCKVQTLWPYVKDAVSRNSRVVIYPDIFDHGHGLTLEDKVSLENEECRWSQLSTCLKTNWFSSVLPLARVMGAFVTPHLHDGVSHVICDLVDPHNEIVYSKSVNLNVFADRKRGFSVMERLHDLDNIRIHFVDVKLVSPDWLRKRKWALSD
jgi:hypothetical protein